MSNRRIRKFDGGVPATDAFGRRRAVMHERSLRRDSQPDGDSADDSMTNSVSMPDRIRNAEASCRKRHEDPCGGSGFNSKKQ